MKKQTGVVIMGILSGLLGGCSSDSVQQYQHDTPKLNLEQYLSGHITGSGLIQTRSGTVSSRFDFSATGSWKGDVGILDENMTYYNGKKDHRIWTIRKVGEGHYIGTTPEVIGSADIHVAGNAMHWRYKMDVNVKGKTYRLNFDDWMFLMKNGALINVNHFKKFGFHVGSLTLFMQKKP